MADPPVPREVTHFRFKQLRNLKIANAIDNVNKMHKNLLAVSNKYGLIFVGETNGFRMLRTFDIEMLDDTKLSRVDAVEYQFSRVNLSSELFHLTLSNDDLTLAACVIHDGCPNAEMFDVRSFAKLGATVGPFMSVRLSANPNVRLVDFIWNPTGSMFVTCLSDGSATVYEIVDSTLKIYGSLPHTTNSSAVCWSPKGKQLVVGKTDGTLIQYLPNLQVAKANGAPDIFESVPTVANIAWLSSYQFAVVYRVEDRPHLVLVNAPKAKPATFLDFGDICFSTCELWPLQYYMIHHPKLKTLFCTSTNSVEVGVLAAKGDGTEWEQWLLEDSGRAELPLAGSDETYPLGMVLSTTSQRNIPINDTDTILPKPMLHILSTGGVLSSFYVIMDHPDLDPLVTTPEFLLAEGARTALKTTETSPSNVGRLNAESQPFSSGIASSGPTSQNAGFPKENLLPKFNEVSKQHLIDSGSSRTSMPAMLAASSGVPPNVSVPATLSSNKSPSSLASVPSSKSPMTGATSGGSITSGTPLSNASGSKLELNTFAAAFTSGYSFVSHKSGAANVPTQNQLPKPTPILQPQPSAKPMPVGSSAFSSQLPSHAFEKPSVNKAPTSVPDAGGKETSAKPRTRKTPGRTAVVAAFQDELLHFRLEMAQVQKRSLKLTAPGKIEDEKAISDQLEQLEKFVDDIQKSTKVLNFDFHALRGGVLEVFGAIEEGRSLSARTKDKSLTTLQKSRRLDSMSAKKLKDIKSLFYYLENQLQEVNVALDRMWEKSKATRKGSARLTQWPTLEMIYKTMVTIQNITANLKIRIQGLETDGSRIVFGRRPLSRMHENVFSADPHGRQALLRDRDSGTRSWTSSSEGSLNRMDKLRASLPCSTNVSGASTAALSGTVFTSTKISREKQERLRSLFDKRPVTRVRPLMDEFSRLRSPGNTLRDSGSESSSSTKDEEVLDNTLGLKENEVHVEESTSLSRVADQKGPSGRQGLGRDGNTTGAFTAPQPSLFSNTRKLGFSFTSLISEMPQPTAPSQPNIFTLAATKGPLPMNVTIAGVPLETASEQQPNNGIRSGPKNESVSSLESGIKKPLPIVQKSLNFEDALLPTYKNSKGMAASSSTPIGLLGFAPPATNFFPAFSSRESTISSRESTTIHHVGSSLVTDHHAALGAKDEPVDGNKASCYEDVTPPLSSDVSVAEDGHVADGNAVDGYADKEEENGGDGDEGLVDEEEEEEDEEEEGEEEEEVESEGDELPVSKTAAAGNKLFNFGNGSETTTGLNTKFSTHLGTEMSHVVSDQIRSECGIGLSVVSASQDAKIQRPVQLLSSPASGIEAPKAAPAFATSNTAGATPLLPTSTKPDILQATNTISLSTPSAFTAQSWSAPSQDVATSSSPPNLGTVTIETTAKDVTESKPDSPSGAEPQTTNATEPSLPVVPSSQPSTAAISFRFTSPGSTVSSTVSTTAPSGWNAFKFTVPPQDSNTVLATTTAPALGVSTGTQPSQVSSGGSIGWFGSETSFTQSTSSAEAVTSPTTTSSTTSVFGGSKPAFGGPFSFGHSGSSSFGTTAGGSAFGQTKAPAFGQSVFGQQQPQPAISPFGQSAASGSNLFGQGGGGFFSGLGSKPNPENANKNIFGTSTFGSSPTSTSIFGGSAVNQDRPTLWGKQLSGSSSNNSFIGGAFSSSSGTSVNQAGFGGFQTQPSPPRPVLGGQTAFGSPPTFGGAPAFGSMNSMGNTVFGSSATPSSGFGAAATANDSLSFGTLAAQSPGSVFGTPPPPAAPTAFGSSTQFGSGSAFGSQGCDIYHSSPLSKLHVDKTKPRPSINMPFSFLPDHLFPNGANTFNLEYL